MVSLKSLGMMVRDNGQVVETRLIDPKELKDIKEGADKKIRSQVEVPIQRISELSCSEASHQEANEEEEEDVQIADDPNFAANEEN